MRNNIPPIPDLPPAILAAIAVDSFAVFTGAGISRLAGCMGWDDLADQFINLCRETESADGTQLLSDNEAEILKKKEKDNRKKITVCEALLSTNAEGSELFWNEMEEGLKPKANLIIEPTIYDEVYKLRGLHITTNADRLFDEKLFETDRIVYREEEFLKRSNIDSTKLYHIHGSINDYGSMVFTLEQYIKRYALEHFKRFLRGIFDTRTVLFLGYSMEESELLHNIWIRNAPRDRRHYMLKGYTANEESQLNIDEVYLGLLGINVIPFLKGDRGHAGLFDVLCAWNGHINEMSTHLNDSFNDIDDAIDDFDENKANRIFQIVRNDAPQQNYFFTKLAGSSNPIPWLNPAYERGYFSPDRNPLPIADKHAKGYHLVPRWNALQFLESVAEANRRSPDNPTTALIVQIIEPIMDWMDPNTGTHRDNDFTDWMILRIAALLPSSNMAAKHIEFVRTALNANARWGNILISGEVARTVLPRLIEASRSDLILVLLKIMFGQVLGTDSRIYPVMELDFLDDAMTKYNPEIARLCGNNAAALGVAMTEEQLSENTHSFNYTSIPNIEGDIPAWGENSIQSCLVRFTRDMLLMVPLDSVTGIVRNVLRKEHMILKRIAYYVIDSKYSELKNCLWGMESNPIVVSWYNPELYSIIEQRFEEFSDAELAKLLEWVATAEFPGTEKIEDPDERQAFIALRRKEWIVLLLKIEKPEIRLAYNEYDAINPAETVPPDGIVGGPVFLGGRSPVSSEKLQDMTNQEIAQYVASAEADSNGPFGLTRRGLGDALEACVEADPERFSSDISDFSSIPYYYVYSMLLGFNASVRDGKKLIWRPILKFVEDMITGDDFWNVAAESAGDRNLIITWSVRLISSGLDSAGGDFVSEYGDTIETVLLLFEENAPPASRWNEKHLLTDLINSPKGVIYRTLIIYSLKSASATLQATGQKWKFSIKQRFQERMDNPSAQSYEFWTSLGHYLQNLHYLDGGWVEQHLSRIFSTDDDGIWQDAFAGYLQSSRSVYPELYELAKNGGHYTKALEHSFTDEQALVRLVQHICVGYMADWEDIGDPNSLIRRLIDRSDVDQLNELITFFVRRGKESPNSLSEKVKALWLYVSQALNERCGEEPFRGLMADLTMWLSSVDEIDDDIVQRVNLSIPHLNLGRGRYSFVKNLRLHAERSLERVAQLYLNMLDQSIFIEFVDDDTKAIVERLYESGMKDEADRICNILISRGHYFLRDLYESNQ